MSESGADGAGGREERGSGQLEAYEQRRETSDVQDIHAQVLREKAEPRDGHEAIPVALFIAILALCMWGGWYLSEHDADYDPRVLDGPAAFARAPARAGGTRTQARLDPMAVGKRSYASYCITCHQPDGKGIPGSFPPLAGSEWVLGDERILARIVLHGLQGPITLEGITYDDLMPARGTLSDVRLAGVLTYIRSSWGNRAGEVTPESVAAVRAAERARQGPWTAAELRAVAATLPPVGEEGEGAPPAEDGGDPKDEPEKGR